MPIFKRAQIFALILIGAMLIVPLLIAALILLTGPLPLIVQYLLIYGLAYALPLLLYFLRFRTEMPCLTLRLKKIRPCVLAEVFLTALLIQPFLMCVSSITSLFFPNYLEGSLETYVQQPYFETVLATCVLPAICEELVCRGLYLSGCAPLKRPAAAALSALFFAILHLNLQQGIYAFLFGLFAAYLVLFSGSILASVFFHFTINTCQITLSYLWETLPEESAFCRFMNRISASGSFPVLFSVSLVLAAAAIWLLTRIRLHSGTSDTRSSDR